MKRYQVAKILSLNKINETDDSQSHLKLVKDLGEDLGLATEANEDICNPLMKLYKNRRKYYGQLAKDGRAKLLLQKFNRASEEEV